MVFCLFSCYLTLSVCTGFCLFSCFHMLSVFLASLLFLDTFHFWEFFISPVFRHFLYSWDFVVSPGSSHFWPGPVGISSPRLAGWSGSLSTSPRPQHPPPPLPFLPLLLLLLFVSSSSSSSSLLPAQSGSNSPREAAARSGGQEKGGSSNRWGSRNLPSHHSHQFSPAPNLSLPLSLENASTSLFHHLSSITFLKLNFYKNPFDQNRTESDFSDTLIRNSFEMAKKCYFKFVCLFVCGALGTGRVQAEQWIDAPHTLPTLAAYLPPSPST